MTKNEKCWLKNFPPQTTILHYIKFSIDVELFVLLSETFLQTYGKNVQNPKNLYISSLKKFNAFLPTGKVYPKTILF